MKQTGILVVGGAPADVQSVQAAAKAIERPCEAIALDAPLPTHGQGFSAIVIFAPGDVGALARRFASLAPGIPVLLCLDDEQGQPSSRDVTGVYCLQKPLNEAVIRAKLAAMLASMTAPSKAPGPNEAVVFERRQHVVALRARDQRLRRIIDNTRDYAFIGTDADGRITEWEGGAEVITGWSVAEAIGQYHTILFTPEDRAACKPEQEIEKARLSGRADDKRWHVRRDASRFYADGVLLSVKDEAGQLQGFAKIFRDATAERQAEDRLRASEEHLRESRARVAQLLNSAGEGICGLDLDARCVFINPAGAAMLGYAPGELIGQPFGVLAGAAMPASARVGSAVKAGATLRVDNDLFTCKDGKTLPVTFSVYPVAESAGAVVTFSDVSERQRAQALSAGQRRALELAVAGAPLSDILNTLVHTAEAYGEHQWYACVRLLDDDGQHLRHGAAPSLPAGFCEATSPMQVDMHSGSCAACVLLRTSVFSADIASDPIWSNFHGAASEAGLVACRSLPIMSAENRVLGSFAFYYRQPHAPTQAESEAQGLLANSAALVLDRLRATRERKAAEARAHVILENIPEAFIAIDADWRISYANAAAEAATGAPRDQAPGRDFWHVYPGIVGGPIERACRATAATRVPQRCEVWYAPHSRWFDVNTFPTEEGGIALYFRDISERKQADSEVRRLAAVAAQSTDFIGIATPAGACTYVNPAGRRMSGIPAHAAIGAYTVLDFFPSETRQLVEQAVLPKLQGPAGQWEGELQFRHFGSGEVFPVLYKAFVVRDEAGAVIAQATITRDITEQKAAENQLRRIAADLSETDRQRSEFLATLAHELRNPLAPIRSGLQVMRLSVNDAGAITRVGDMLERQLGHLIHLVDDLLDSARITRGKIVLQKARVDLASVVASAVETCQAQIDAAGHHLELDLGKETLLLDVDPTRIAQVLSNLLNNAAKYTPQGGRISLRARRGADDSVVLTVADSGVGIPPDALPSVFEMFTQVGRNMGRAQGGLGIGLSLVRRLVELHGGTVEASSPGPDQGSSFVVRLPLARGVAAGALAPLREVASPPLHLLVVDDNRDGAEALVAMLAMSGHTARIATDGASALVLARQFRPDVIFLDIGLPDMNGYEVARALRHSDGLAGVSLVALTGWGTEDDRRRSADAGFDAHLTKPADMEEVEQLLARLRAPPPGAGDGAPAGSQLRH